MRGIPPPQPLTQPSTSIQIDLFLPKTITATKNNAEKVSALLSRCSLEMSGWRGAGPNLQVSDLTRWQSNHITHTAATTLKKPQRSCWWHISSLLQPSSWSTQLAGTLQKGYGSLSPIGLSCKIT